MATFQFKNKKYSVDDVINDVLERIRDPSFMTWCKDRVRDEVSRVQEPSWESKEVKTFGKNYFKRKWEKELSDAGKKGTTECINKVFNDVIGGGTISNPHAPETVEAIDEDVIAKTLDRIRGIRRASTRRAWTRTG